MPTKNAGEPNARPAPWFTCKQLAGSTPCGARFHPDDVEDFKEHLEAHGVVLTTEWWDEEMGASLAADSRMKPTPVEPSQFGDGSDTQRKENARNWHNLKEMERTSGHNVSAKSFEGARVIAPSSKMSTPESGVSLASSVTSSSSSAVGGLTRRGSARSKNVSSSTGRKGTERTMGTATKTAGKATPANKYANIGVNMVESSAVENAAPRFCLTTGRGYTDVEAIKKVLSAIQGAHPDAVITNQGKWEGDKLVMNTARAMGISYEMTLPRFLKARNAGQPLIGENERMTPEQDAEFGFKRVQTDLAESCVELHVFGTPSGPQIGLTDAFKDVEKEIYRWGASS